MTNTEFRLKIVAAVIGAHGAIHGQTVGSGTRDAIIKLAFQLADAALVEEGKRVALGQ
jgi:hypothetical protein